MTAPDPSETLASNPVERSSYDECARALSVLATREGRREVYVKITEKAGLDLLPAASWMLLRIKRHGTVEPARLAEIAPVPLRVISEAGRQLEERGLARRVGVQLVLTEPGAEVGEALARPGGVPGGAAGRLVGPRPPDRPGRPGVRADGRDERIEQGAAAQPGAEARPPGLSAGARHTAARSSLANQCSAYMRRWNAGTSR